MAWTKFNILLLTAVNNYKVSFLSNKNEILSHFEDPLQVVYHKHSSHPFLSDQHQGLPSQIKVKFSVAYHLMELVWETGLICNL